MLRYSIALLICSCLASAQDMPVVPASMSNHRLAPKRLLWKLSVGALVATQFLDARSSWGLPEANAILRSPSGRFGGKAVGLKTGMIGGTAFTQWRALRKPWGSAALYTVVNFAVAAATAAVAARNYSIRGEYAH